MNGCTNDVDRGCITEEHSGKDESHAGVNKTCDAAWQEQMVLYGAFAFLQSLP